ncbi:glycosyltransferase involved in cell wall biosynthesis [Bradyrhizobium huanghuaihaiense]|uniref:Glycosyl transferase family 2 n=1 Tax=Bradyrhizobium huanghuaihaiense TaxID=990078 RepID=A0A562R392_9BRAD|nr:glycosyltransferase family A protein [Bradyrhizobium huanghuaihaiense]TWI63293.1 glycosyl transferase family 2 [Bradyrhizobium huanghuaihaiense]
MTRQTPLVSIVIPLYNKADFILRTVASAASQLDVAFEIIVVDDGSTDDGAKLVHNAGLEGLFLIAQENAGVSAARNRGMTAARGKWIAFLDADDVWSCEHLATLLKAIDGSDAIAAFSNVRLQSRASCPLIDPRLVAQRVEDYFSFALRSGGYPISSSSIIALKDKLVAAGLFVEGISTGEDIDMWCRLACQGAFFYTAKLTATYNDARSHTRCSASGTVVRPFSAQRLHDLIASDELDPRLAESGRRYANFLMLEYARQLLDSGQYADARAVLLGECVPRYDPKRFLKRLIRTTSFGQTLFGLGQTHARQA